MKKNFIKALIVLALFVLCQHIYFKYQTDKIKNQNFTQYELSLDELYNLQGYYALTFEEAKYTYTGNIDLRLFAVHHIYDNNKKFTLCPTECTEYAINEINWYIEDRQDLKERAAEYGITTENPITIEWVLANPHEAAALAEDNLLDSFKHRLKNIRYNEYKLNYE